MVKPFDVHLVDDGLVPGPLPRPRAAPGEGGVDDLAFWHEGGAVALVERQVLLRIADHVAEQRVVPLQGAMQPLGVGIDQQLVRVEAVAGLRLIGAVDAIAVEPARAQVGQIAVPDLVGELGQDDARGLAPVIVVEQAELDLLGIRRKQGEVGAGAVPGRAQRIRQTRPDPDTLCSHAGFLSCVSATTVAPPPRTRGHLIGSRRAAPLGMTRGLTSTRCARLDRS
jgi:hypothetical protein